MPVLVFLPDFFPEYAKAPESGAFLGLLFWVADVAVTIDPELCTQIVRVA
ncbi:MAG: hypothetical protein KDI41_14190 [Pseudomonadales bacterium]|jgi:hypothetical protein|nr:hypothetical protein [uncultured Pseudomonas sp.]MCB1655004.1 hypothetical protein [Pseudomonadales bacterium]